MWLLAPASNSVVRFVADAGPSRTDLDQEHVNELNQTLYDNIIGGMQTQGFMDLDIRIINL